MNGTSVYIVAAAIIVVVVVVLLSYWTIRQARKHEVKRTPGVMTPRQDGDRSSAAGAVFDAAGTAEAPDSDGLRASPGQLQEAQPGSEWRPEHRPPLVLARSEAEDGMRHLDEDQVVGLSAYETSDSAWDGPEPLAGTEPGGQLPVESVGGGAAEGSVSADSLSGTEPSLRTHDGSPAADDFHALLRRRLQHPAVLGWLVVSADGEFRDGDQVYDDRVLALLTTLAANARETAMTVGLTAPREVVVRGAEGVICVVPADQIEAGRSESVVVFVEDGGPSPGEVARRLGAQGSVDMDDATTG